MSKLLNLYKYISMKNVKMMKNKNDYLNISGKKICGNKNYTFGKPLSSNLQGSMSSTYNINEKSKNGKKLIGKLISNNIGNNYVNNELKMTQIASNLNISPKVEYITRCKINNVVYGIIIMEQYGTNNLHRFLKNNPNKLENITKKVYNSLQKLHNEGFVHGNLHNGNILLQVSKNGELKIKLIDFGESINIMKLNKENIRKWKNANIKKFRWSQQLNY